jgi:hypothetical protein
MSEWLSGQLTKHMAHIMLYIMMLAMAHNILQMLGPCMQQPAGSGTAAACIM